MCLQLTRLDLEVFCKLAKAMWHVIYVAKPRFGGVLIANCDGACDGAWLQTQAQVPHGLLCQPSRRVVEGGGVTKEGGGGEGHHGR